MYTIVHSGSLEDRNETLTITKPIRQKVVKLTYIRRPQKNTDITCQLSVRYYWFQNESSASDCTSQPDGSAASPTAKPSSSRPRLVPSGTSPGAVSTAGQYRRHAGGLSVVPATLVLEPMVPLDAGCLAVGDVYASLRAGIAAFLSTAPSVAARGGSPESWRWRCRAVDR